MALELGGHLSGVFGGLQFSDSRPSLEGFRKALRSVGGSPGADLWSPGELKLIAHSPTLSRTIWDTMSLWEQTGENLSR